MSIYPHRRPDFSYGLVHLTKERGETKPFDVLKEILSSGILKATGRKGYIKGNGKAVCLSEMPLSAIHYFASSPSVTENARYRFYGVALSKQAIFKAGGRPVIYLPDSEAEWIPPEHKWRHVRFDSKVDWTNEREWRVPEDIQLSSLPGIYVMVWSPIEAAEIHQLESPIKGKIRGVLAMQHLTQFL